MIGKNDKLICCPTEILDTILDFLDQDTYATLARCCTYLHSAVQPHLYSNVLLHEGYPADPLFPSEPYKASRFLDTVRRRPETAAYVRSITFDYATRIANPDVAKILPFLPQLRRLQISAACNTGCVTHNWREAVESENFLQQAFSGDLSILPLLDSCSLYYHSGGTMNHGRWSMNAKDMLFMHPFLKTLTITYAIYDETSDQIFKEAATRMTNLETLRLIRCEVKVDILKRVLSLPRALRKFEWIYDYDNTFAMSRARKPGIEAYFEAIAQQRDCLEYLALPNDMHGDLLKSNLREFKSMKALQLPFRFIFGSPHCATVVEMLECLPPNLEHLTLQYTTGYKSLLYLGPWLDTRVRGSYNLLLELAAHKPGRLPCLTDIVLDEEIVIRSDTGSEDLHESAPDFAAVFSPIGVKLVHHVTKRKETTHGKIEQLRRNIDLFRMFAGTYRQVS